MRNANINFQSLKGPEAKEYIGELAQLRMQVFHEWPYIYEGSLQYEKKYLATYFKSSNSFVCLARDQDKIIGASTAVWLPDADENSKRPFLDLKIDLSTVCYFGESVLLPKYRGKGIGLQFMQRREEFAQQLKSVNLCAFCAVKRPKYHPMRPKDYKSLETFWQRYGFIKQPQVTTEFSWQDIGDSEETKKPMEFWFKIMKTKSEG